MCRAGILLFGAAFLILHPPTAQARGLELTYAIESETSDSTENNTLFQGKPQNNSKVATSTLRVTLAPDWFCVENGQRSDLYDLNAKRVLQFDITSYTLQNGSMYYDPINRVFEFQNRLFIQGAWEAGTGEKNPDTELELECLFAMRSPSKEKTKPASRKLTSKKEQDGSVHFLLGTTDTVSSVQFSSATLDHDLTHADRCFLARNLQVHPTVRQAMASTDRLLREANFRIVDSTTRARTNTTITLTSQRELEHPDKPTTAGFALQYSRDADLDKLIRRAYAFKANGKFPDRESVRANINKARTEGRYLDALLCNFEFGFTTGQHMNEETRFSKEDADKDPDLKAFISTRSPSSEDEAKTNVKKLESLKKDTLQKSYVIDILLADDLESLGNSEQAQKLFFKVLESHPEIVGAWKDLGGLYMHSYNFSDAWACYDTARHLVPDHEMLEEVTELEKHVSTDYPEFF